MKTILITGGFGFIGRNLNEYFIQKYKVFAPSHEELDLLDGDKVRDYIKRNRIKLIIHGANVGGGRDTQNQIDVIGINLRMFFNIIRNEDLLDRIINFGSGAEYGKSRDLKKVREADFDKIIPIDDYGFYKYICSKYIFSIPSMKIINLRLFGVYGKYENYLFKFISNSIVKNLLHQSIVIGQNVLFDYLYISDLCKIVDYFLGKNGEFRDYNVVSSRKTDLITITEIINEISDYKSKVVIQNKGLNLEYTADNSRLKKELMGFKFTSLSDGIADLYHWYKIHLKEIDKERVFRDPYINLIKVNR